MPDVEKAEHVCTCGHGFVWHHETRGCGYFGNGINACPCAKDCDTALSDYVAARVVAAKADGVRLGIEYVESFQADYANGGHALSADGALHALKAALSSLSPGQSAGDVT